MVCFEDGKITGTEVKGKGVEATDTHPLPWGKGWVRWVCDLSQRCRASVARPVTGLVEALTVHRYPAFLFVDILEEHRKSDEEGYADQIFDTLDVGIEINHGVQWFHHPGG